MGMTADDCLDPSRRWVEIQDFDIVKDIDEPRPNLEQLLLRHCLRPFALIVIPSDGEYGCDRLQLFKNLRLADVSGVQNQLNPLEGTYRFGTDQAVGIRD